MSTHGLPLSRIDAGYLDSLRTDAVAEGRELEYKEQLPGGDDDSKREFLRDVASFANSVGGDLIYGVRETRDAAGKPTGVPDAIVGLPSANLDQEMLRLESVVRNGVEPRIPAVIFRVISREAGPPCLLVRVHQSPLRLHMVTYKGMSRFYGRGTSGRFELDVGQIRVGFLEVETAQERVRRFRLDRVARVIAGETPVQMAEGAKLIFHALPQTRLDIWPAAVKVIENSTHILNSFSALGFTPSNWRHNLDGFVAYATSSTGQRYVQLFRDGGIESAGGILNVDARRRGFYGSEFEEATIKVLTAIQRLWQPLGVIGPIMLALTLSGLKGQKMLAGELWERDETVDVDLAIIPDAVLQDERTPAEQALKPLFDLAWNAGGWAQSPLYNPDGSRIRAR
jgi:hypothetical protein